MSVIVSYFDGDFDVSKNDKGKGEIKKGGRGERNRLKLLKKHKEKKIRYLGWFGDGGARRVYNENFDGSVTPKGVGKGL